VFLIIQYVKIIPESLAITTRIYNPPESGPHQWTQSALDFLNHNSEDGDLKKKWKEYANGIDRTIEEGAPLTSEDFKFLEGVRSSSYGNLFDYMTREAEEGQGGGHLFDKNKTTIKLTGIPIKLPGIKLREILELNGFKEEDHYNLHVKKKQMCNRGFEYLTFANHERCKAFQKRFDRKLIRNFIDTADEISTYSDNDYCIDKCRASPSPKKTLEFRVKYAHKQYVFPQSVIPRIQVDFNGENILNEVQKNKFETRKEVFDMLQGHLAQDPGYSSGSGAASVDQVAFRIDPQKSDVWVPLFQTIVTYHYFLRSFF